MTTVNSCSDTSAQYIINKVDKGLTIVIQDETDYIKEAMQYLNDTTTYQSLPGDHINDICKQI